VAYTLTWEGAELLDAIVDERIWTKVKNALHENGTVFMAEILKSLAGSIVSAGARQFLSL